jgi:hypothetical protein
MAEFLMLADAPVPAVAVAVAVVLLASVWFFLRGGDKGPDFMLHGYQKDFLEAFAASGTPAVEKCKKKYGLEGAAAGLQAIAEELIYDATKRSEVFDTFHCVHCGSVKPAEWISTNKGNKAPHALRVSKEVVALLSKPLLVPVEKRGDPPKRQIVEGPKFADHSKAARCCVDWAIKRHGALATGKPTTRTTRSNQGSYGVVTM